MGICQKTQTIQVYALWPHFHHSDPKYQVPSTDIPNYSVQFMGDPYQTSACEPQLCRTADGDGPFRRIQIQQRPAYIFEAAKSCKKELLYIWGGILVLSMEWLLTAAFPVDLKSFPISKLKDCAHGQEAPSFPLLLRLFLIVPKRLGHQQPPARRNACAAKVNNSDSMVLELTVKGGLSEIDSSEFQVN